MQPFGNKTKQFFIGSIVILIIGILLIKISDKAKSAGLIMVLGGLFTFIGTLTVHYFHTFTLDNYMFSKIRKIPGAELMSDTVQKNLDVFD